MWCFPFPTTPLLTHGIEGQYTSTFGQMIGQATAPLGAALGDLSSRLAKIECKQPETVTVPYSPIAAVPNCVAYQYGLYGGFNPYAAGNGFWG